MNPLELRKQLLLAESDLNRAALAANLAELKTALGALAERAKLFAATAAAAGAVMAALAAFRRGKPAGAVKKPSWWLTLLENATLISSLWRAFRPEGRKKNPALNPKPREAG